jgi:hypothetical protein
MSVQYNISSVTDALFLPGWIVALVFLDLRAVRALCLRTVPVLARRGRCLDAAKAYLSAPA